MIVSGTKELAAPREAAARKAAGEGFIFVDFSNLPRGARVRGEGENLQLDVGYSALGIGD